MRRLRNIFDLGVKELHSILRDPVLMFLMAWAFSVGVLTPGKGAGDASVHNAGIAIVDDDGSALSRRLADAFHPPYFLPPQQISAAAVDELMDRGAVTFVLVIPVDFERDLIAGETPSVQLLIDATRMKQAGIGAGYVRNIVNEQAAEFLYKSRRGAPASPVELVVRTSFNPNLAPGGFQGLVALLIHSTLFPVVLTGAAVVRERERGTIQHALAMPVSSFELMVGKIWANALVITAVITASILVVLKGALDLTIAGSVPLLLGGVVTYLFSTTAIGIFLATIVRSMPQLGLLAIMVVVPMGMLSGNSTPLESQPEALQRIMQLAPSTHYVSFTQAVIFRGATLADVWFEILMMAGIGLALFIAALLRFRRSMAAAQG